MNTLKKFNIIVISYLLIISVVGIIIFSSDKAEAQSPFSLYDAAITHGYVSVVIQGDYSGYDEFFTFENGDGAFFGRCIEMQVTNELSSSIQVKVTLGRQLICRESEIQDMVVTREYILDLISYETETILVYAMCIDMPEAAPAQGVYYDLGSICTGDIYNVVSEISNSGSQDTTGQCALWGVTDGACGDYLKQYGASNNDLNNAQGILDAAGVDYNIEEGSEGGSEEGIPLIWIIFIGVIIVVVILIVILTLISKKKKRRSTIQPGPQVHFVQSVQPSSPAQPVPPVQQAPAQPVHPIQPVPPVKPDSPVKITPNFCPNCGSALQTSGKSCTECGHQI